jgi:S-adenosylmethionine decarboxylase
LQRIAPHQEIKLQGFNNLTKSLNFNLYDFCVARNESERASYIKYITDRFNAKKITHILKGICGIIEAQVLAVSDQDYEPWGASSLLLMSDLKGGGVSMHLDKSHICAHTYPDFHAGGTICSFRIDIGISTCGQISPLNALNFMFQQFDSDVVVIDYTVRGYTRAHDGKRVYMDHALRSIQDYIDPKTLDDYHCVDLTLQSENIWQTKMLRMRQNTPTYFRDPVDPGSAEVQGYMEAVNREMRGILQGWPD